MSFRSVFIAVVIAFALLVGALLVNRARPRGEVERPTAALVAASGRCAQCHYREQYSVVLEYQMSVHAQQSVNCLDCHQPAEGQARHEHHGFVIAEHITPANCKNCHATQYDQFERSRHAAPAWAAVYGAAGLTPEQVTFSERYQPGGTNRAPNVLTRVEGATAVGAGCEQCHGVGRPNADGTVGTCTACHTRHTSSVAVARLPTTCGQCHMGPDHSQLEIYEESKHGVLFEAQRHLLHLDASPKTLTTRDMWIPTCATCHMSGINGLGVTHEPSSRLSYFLAAAITQQRPQYAQAQAAMKQVCRQCHTDSVVVRVYHRAEQVVTETNGKVQTADSIMQDLRTRGVLKGAPFTQPIEFMYFDLWHYDGRTAKHGAFMGGADFVQWHGNYPLLQRMVTLRAMARELKRQGGSQD